LLKPGGLVLITIPNYAGIYGLLQRWCDAKSLEMHNLEIMNLESLKTLVDSPNIKNVRAYHSGVISPWLISFDKLLPNFAAKSLSFFLNAIGLLQPTTIDAIAPMLVLEIRKGTVE
jgi:hypothetical protein